MLWECVPPGLILAQAQLVQQGPVAVLACLALYP